MKLIDFILTNRIRWNWYELMLQHYGNEQMNSVCEQSNGIGNRERKNERERSRTWITTVKQQATPRHDTFALEQSISSNQIDGN